MLDGEAVLGRMIPHGRGTKLRLAEEVRIVSWHLPESQQNNAVTNHCRKKMLALYLR